MPALWSHNTGQDVRLASVFEPWSDLILAGVRDQCTKSGNFTKKKDKSGRDTPRLEHRGRTRENASDPDSGSVCGCQKAPERQHHDLYSGFKKKKNTQHLLSKQPRCQSSASEADNRCPTPEFNTHTTNYSIKVKGRGGKGKNLLSSPSKAVTTAPRFALFRKQSHPAACVIGQSKGGKTGKMVIILQLYVMKEGKNHKCQALGVLSLILVPVVAKRRVDGLPRSLSCGRGSGTEKRK